MNLPKNLIVALIALSCYVRCNNINLANNTTILLIVLALLAKGNFDINDIIDNDNNNRSGRSGSTCQCQDNNYNNNTRTIYATPYARSGYPFQYGYNNYPYTTIYQTSVPANNGYGCPCSCNNVVY